MAAPYPYGYPAGPPAPYPTVPQAPYVAGAPVPYSDAPPPVYANGPPGPYVVGQPGAYPTGAPQPPVNGQLGHPFYWQPNYSDAYYYNQDEYPYDADSYYSRDYSDDSASDDDTVSVVEHSHHRSDDDKRPALQIRRHIPGASDPVMQQFPANLEASNYPPPLENVRVSIRRNSPPKPEAKIQPVLYPIPIYVQQPVPAIASNPPVQIIQPIMPAQPVIAVQPVEQKKEVPKPPSPKPPAAPTKTMAEASVQSDRYETESFALPTSRSQINATPVRKPIRTGVTDSRAIKHQPTRRPPGRYIVEEYEFGDGRKRPMPPTKNTQEKSISYRNAVGPTTRELENDAVSDSRKNVYLRSPQKQVVTYRKS